MSSFLRFLALCLFISAPAQAQVPDTQIVVATREAPPFVQERGWHMDGDQHRAS